MTAEGRHPRTAGRARVAAWRLAATALVAAWSVGAQAVQAPDPDAAAHPGADPAAEGKAEAPVQAAAPVEAAETADRRLEVRADRLEWDDAARRVRLLGDARLTLDGATLAAPELIVDLSTRRATAPDGGRLAEGGRRLSAERLELDLDGPFARAEDAVLDVVEGGRRRLRLSARRLVRMAPSRYRAEGVVATLCDCDDDVAPDWSVRAARARVVEDEGVWLTWPVLRIKDVPVLPLPVLYVPLADRKSGLLLPALRWSGRNGLEVAEPLYLVLGRSWDLTLTPGLWTGGGGGVAGPELGLEVRYAPTERVRGTLFTQGLWDTGLPEAADPARALLTWRHRSRWGAEGSAPHTGLAADLQLFTDAALLSDLALRLEGREPGLSRSLARAYAGGPKAGAEVGVRFLQDLRSPRVVRDGEAVPRPLFGDAADGVPVTFQRLPEGHGGSAWRPLAGGVAGRVGFHGIAWRPQGASFDDWGLDGLAPGDLGWCAAGTPGCADAGEGDGVAGPGEFGRLLFGRLEADIARAWHLGEAAVVRLGAGGRADGWRFAALPGRPADTAARLYGLLDARVSTAVARRFGAWRHRVEPWARWRWLPAPEATGVPPDLSAFDRSAPADGLHQLALGLDTGVTRAGAAPARLSLVQRVDLASGRVDEASLELELAPFGRLARLAGRAAWDWRGGMRLLDGRLSFRLPGEVALGVTGVWLAAEGSSLLRAGLDELFAGGALPPPPLATAPEGPRDMGDLRVSLGLPVAPWLSVRAQLRVDPAGERAPQPALTLDARSTCGCWRLALTTIWPPGQAAPEVSLGLGLGGL